MRELELIVSDVVVGRGDRGGLPERPVDDVSAGGLLLGAQGVVEGGVAEPIRGDLADPHTTHEALRFELSEDSLAVTDRPAPGPRPVARKRAKRDAVGSAGSAAMVSPHRTRDDRDPRMQPREQRDLIAQLGLERPGIGSEPVASREDRHGGRRVPEASLPIVGPVRDVDDPGEGPGQ